MYLSFNPEQRRILDDISARSNYGGGIERDVIEYNGRRVIFEGWAVSMPPTGLIPKAVAVLGYEMGKDFVRITEDTAKTGMEAIIREKWKGRVTNIYFIQPETGIHFTEEELCELEFLRYLNRKKS